METLILLAVLGGSVSAAGASDLLTCDSAGLKIMYFGTFTVTDGGKVTGKCEGSMLNEHGNINLNYRSERGTIMKGLSLWGFIFVALSGQVAFAKDQLKCSLIESDDFARKNITLFTNNKKPGDPSFKIITIKQEENEIDSSYTQPVETFSKCSTNNEGFVFQGRHIPQSTTDCQKNGVIHADPNGGSFNVRKLENASASYSPKSGSWFIDYQYAWLDYSVGGQELIGLSVADAERGKYACY